MTPELKCWGSILINTKNKKIARDNETDYRFIFLKTKMYK